MGQQYQQDAVDYCFKLYLKYNGGQFVRIEKEMQRAGWEKWRNTLLFTRGKGKDRRLGWIEKFNWEKGLKEHLAQKVAPSLDTAEKLARDIEMVCDGLAAEIRSKGVAKTDKERLQLFRDFGNLQISSLIKIMAARDTLSGWVNFFEKLLPWAVEIDARLGRTLIKFSEQLIARAEQEFGEKRSDYADYADGADMNVGTNPEDEGAESGT